MIPWKNAMRFAMLGALMNHLAFVTISCGGKKEEAAPAKQATVHDITGDWRSDIESADRQISRSHYRIEQKRDSVSIRLVSTISPLSDELVPEYMIFEAAGEWQGEQLRLRALSWVSGKDTCVFVLRGAMDPNGRLLLFYPADLCGEKNLPFTRKLAPMPADQEE